MMVLEAVSIIVLHIIFLHSKACSGALQANYMGCFRAFGIQNENASASAVLSSSNGMSVEICIDTCMRLNSTYAAIQRDFCFCGEEFEGQLSEKNCQAECPGNRLQLCGGSDGQSYSTYTVCATGSYGPLCDEVCHCHLLAVCSRLTGSCPTGCDKNWQGAACNQPNISPKKAEWYIGCYNDNDTSAMDVKNPDGTTGYETRTNTIQFCRQICAQYNYTYLGTQYVYDCNCGERYNKYGQSNRCNYRCSNNQSQFCGGNYANSVYSVCPTGSYAKNCLSRCNCLNNSRCVLRNGSCPNACKPGWSGISCSNRDCQTESGDCSHEHEICETVDLKYATITRCGCRKGYSRRRPWETCSDFDECQSGTSKCNITTGDCANNIGSYTESKRSVTVGIVLVTLLAISLFINAFFFVSRVKSAKSRKTGITSTDVNYEIPVPAHQSRVYEEIVQEQRRVEPSQTSDYAELRHDDYSNVVTSI